MTIIVILVVTIDEQQDGRTALTIAAERRNGAVVELLVGMGAEVHVENNEVSAWCH